MTDLAPKPAFTINGRHVLAGLVLFFAVIIGVDALFISLAYRTFSGEVAGNPYEAGLEYNRTLALRARQAALGWTATIDQAGGETIVVHVADRSGAPLTGLAVTGALRRPATSRGQRTLSFTAGAEGDYRAAAVLDGAWDLHVTIRDGQGALFEADRRLVGP
jgi:nitrogen fixation protein FixH